MLSKNNSYAIILRIVFFISFILGILFTVFAQQENNKFAIDSTLLLKKTDSIFVKVDSLKLKSSLRDSTKTAKKSNPIKDKVIYKSTDSLRFNVKEKKVYLFNSADISYQKINLKADFVDMDFNKNQVFAKGVEDTAGNILGSPVFKESDKSFNTKELNYNFTTKKGLIKEVITKENEGYVHGELVKKMPDDITYIKNGKFTTCDLEHPHFDIRFGRAKAIPDKEIVTGPAFLYIEDIPTPLFVPVGFFPNSKKQTSGILFPAYGESPNRGFYFENGGYYFAISDKMDLALRGDIYTRGSWAIKALSNYNKRYCYNGNFSFNYIVDILGDKGTSTYSKNTNYSFIWNYNQDVKASPNSNFRASVNVVSSKFNQSVRDLNNLFTNTTNSSISYSTNFGDDVFLTASTTESYNTNTHVIDLDLPNVSLNTNTFYPLRKKVQVGGLKWYENISINYAMNAQNTINSTDSTIFNKSTFNNMQNGIKHSIPISSNIKLFKYFTLTNSVGYLENWYYKTIRKNWDAKDSILKIDTLNGFAAAREFSYRAAINTTVYGMVQFKKGFIRAIRHVVQPSVAFTYRPDFAAPFWGNMRTYTDATGKLQRYSIYENTLFGGPPVGKSGSLSFSLSNNLEMKVNSKKDTVTGMKKIVLIENLSFSTAYDIAADSLKWAPLSISGRTTLFKQLYISYGSTWDPYTKTFNGSRVNQYEWDVNRRMYRLDNTNWNLSMNLALNPSMFKKKSNTTQSTTPSAVPPPPSQIRNISNINQILEDNVDFNVNWSANFAYSFSYSSAFNPISKVYVKTPMQNLIGSGSFNLTSKWKIGYSMIYDFNQKQFVVNSIDIYRDLHCWEMRFNWMPMGYLKSWTFTINVKASVLKDLKWDKKKDFRDSTH